MITLPVTKQPQMEWRADMKAWLCRAETALRQWELVRICNYMLGVQAQRRLGIAAGDVRDDIDASITALRQRKVLMAVTGEDPFKSTEARGSRIISLGAN